MKTLGEAIDELAATGALPVSADARSPWRVAMSLRRTSGDMPIHEVDAGAILADVAPVARRGARAFLALLRVDAPPPPARSYETGGASRDAVAETLGLSRGAVEWIEKRALAKLRAALASEGVEAADDLLLGGGP